MLQRQDPKGFQNPSGLWHNTLRRILSVPISVFLSRPNVFIIQKLHRLGIASMFPHQRKEPNTALTHTKICWRERHLGIQWWLWPLRVILGLPTECLALPSFSFRMEFCCKRSHLIQIGNHNGYNRRVILPIRFHFCFNDCHVSVAPFAMPPKGLLCFLAKCFRFV